VRAAVGEQRVQVAELLLVDQPVAVDPCGERLQLRRIQVHGPALRVARARHEPRLLEHLDVLRDRLLGDLERLGQVVDRRRAAAEPGDDAAAHRVGEGHEGPVEAVIGARVVDHVRLLRQLDA
jgi:hypothetical protein